MTVLVTGASGAVGAAVARMLAERGTPVLTADLPQAPSPAKHMRWDLRLPVPEEIAALASRVTAVVHCGRMSGDWGEPEEFHAVNAAGTRRVLDAFPRARFVHLSTTAVYGTDRDHTHLHEEAGPLPEAEYADPFARSAAETERVLTRVRPDALILRPARIYAPFAPDPAAAGGAPGTEGPTGVTATGPDDGIIADMESFRRRGVLRLPGGARNSVMLAHADTVALAALAGIDRPGVSGPINVADPEPYVLREALMTYLARTHHPPVTIEEAPADLAKARAWIRTRRAGRPRAGNRPPHTLTQIEGYVRERTYSLSRLSGLLGVHPEQRLAPRA
ncbi:NAD-dependent epimerase/dehydratase family protein [Brevibacterium album]|uniref:NAD-dependent epimerase/dehydratase family protein n=1 Tax=Brevibacterium album TaxID=417948 RepID=UPI00041B719A|nr:NAD-dependent epimerase/dehydratase family protein [Brevibacterium album]